METGEVRPIMRNMAKFAKPMMMALVLTGLASQADAQGLGGQVDQQAAAPALGGPRTGINVDVPFDGEEICGFEIIVTVDQAPQSIYTGDRNPWPNPPFPIITQVGTNPNQWKLVYGGPNGPCFPRSTFEDSNGVFLGVHFGFNTSLTISHFANSLCFTYDANGVKVPCSGITGHDVHGWNVAVLNDAANHLAIGRVEVALAPDVVDINVLTRGDLNHLDWEPVRLETGIVPAWGSVLLTVPEHLRNRGGWAVFSFEISDPRTSKYLQTTTLQFKLP